MSNTTTGDRIRMLRLQQRLSQRDLVRAARAYVPADKVLVRESISRIENGHTRADSWTLAAIAKALGVNVEYLIGSKDDPSLQANPEYPVPEPNTWGLVARLNELPTELRGQTVELFRDMLDYASSYSRGRLAGILVQEVPADSEVIQLARSVLDVVEDIPEVAAELRRMLAEPTPATQTPGADTV